MDAYVMQVACCKHHCHVALLLPAYPLGMARDTFRMLYPFAVIAEIPSHLAGNLFPENIFSLRQYFGRQFLEALFSKRAVCRAAKVYFRV
jgi:hypothetical protein